MNRDQRKRLGVVIEEIRDMITVADSLRYRALHLPVSAGFDPTSELPYLDVLGKVVDSGDLETAEPLTRATFFSGRKKLGPAHAAGARLIAFHERVGEVGANRDLKAYREGLEVRQNTERAQLESVLQRLGELETAASGTFSDVAHMPITRSEVLSSVHRETCELFLESAGPTLAQVRRLNDATLCENNKCQAAHAAARELIELDTAVRRSQADHTILAARDAARKQFRQERAEVEKLFAKASGWASTAINVLGSRGRAEKAVVDRLSELQRQRVDTKLSSGSVRLLPLVETDIDMITNMRLVADGQLSKGDRRVLEAIRDGAGDVANRLELALGSGGDCRRNRACMAVHDETAELIRVGTSMESNLARLSPASPKGSVKLNGLTDPALGLHHFLSREPDAIELIDGALTERSRKGLAAVVNAGGALKKAVSEVKRSAEQVHAADVVRSLQAMDLEALKKAAEGAIRVSALSNAGLNTVYDVVQFGDASKLVRLEGLGESTAIATEQAARRLFEAVREETPVRIDVKRRDERTEKMLRALRRWNELRKFSPTTDESAIAEALTKLFKANSRATHVLCYPSGGEKFACDVVPTLTAALKRGGGSPSSDDIWKDFLSQPADYFGMLTELGFMTEDEENMHGDLPEDIIEAVRAVDLKRTHLTASLRTYQSFGARFALVQKRVVIGDEMGLGKTLEALAVFAHLRATGKTHFLVVCPAAVVSNWVRETSKHTTLPVSRIHGPTAERKQAVRSWIHKGGVAVTTFDLLTWANTQFRNMDIAAAVFDEAHYIKNPEAKRSIVSAEVMKSVPYVVLMTGTPLENKVLEFRNLIGYIRPDLAESAPEYLASRFRKHVAPAYLRRNQEDVLTELPERVDIDEWMGMSDSDMARYRSAVENSNFMEMRRAAMLSSDSMKFSRLEEIVREAEENGRRVIVFSYFRDVLDKVASRLRGKTFGPLTGSMPAKERQILVDRFSSSSHGAVLVAQITAGGVGLNIQSASVVVICEPQIKPTMEDQAVARAHRMGQTEVVQVHRLLNENSVDERIRVLLKEKKQIFEEFARDSVIAKRATDAVDMTDAELARMVVAAERARLLGQTS